MGAFRILRHAARAKPQNSVTSEVIALKSFAFLSSFCLFSEKTSKLEVDPPEYRQEKKKFKARKNKKTF